MFFVIAHLIACSWRIISDVVDIQNEQLIIRLQNSSKQVPVYAVGWVGREQEKFEGALTDSDLYTMCFEYAMATFSMGYGTVYPTSVWERNFSIVCLIFAGCFYA